METLLTLLLQSLSELHLELSLTSFVNDIITPLILKPALKAAGVENIAQLSWNGVAYGSFLSAVINFLVVGTVLFFVVKAAEKAQNLGKKKKLSKKKLLLLLKKSCLLKSATCLQTNNQIKRSDLLAGRSVFVFDG